MKVLFVCSFKSTSVGRSSYPHRIVQIEKFCRELGANTSLLFLGDLFFSTPVLIQPLSLPFVLRFIREFDVIHAGGSGSAYFFAWAKPLLKRDTLVVYDVHGDTFTESRLVSKGNLDFAGKFIAFQMRVSEYFGFGSASYFITASRRLKQRLLYRNKRIKAENIEVILNGTDLQTYSPLKNSFRSPQNGDLVVTYAGSFRPWQGTDNLIRAAEILANKNVQFKLIGFGENDLSLKKEIRRRLGEKAILIDWLPKEELLVELNKSDVLIIPADGSNKKQSENRVVTYATKLAEFLAIAKPVIVTRLDEGSELVEKYDCGFVCDPNAESIANAIRKATETSREVLARKGLNGRRCAEAELDMTSICTKYMSFLRRILEARSLK